MAIDPIGAVGSQLASSTITVPGPVQDDAPGSTTPKPSDYNAQAAAGLAFAAPLVITSLAPGAATLAKIASLPEVGPVVKLAPIARTSIDANSYFVDVYR